MAQLNYGPTPGSMPEGAIRVSVGTDIQALVDAAPANSVFWIESGVHRLQSITPKDGDHFVGEQGAVLSGSALITTFAREGNYWVIEDQAQQGIRNATDEAAPGAERPGYPETVFFDNKPLTPVASLAELSTGHFYFDYDADRIYLADNPAGHLVEAGQVATAFQGDARNVVIEDLTVEKYDSPIQSSAIGGTSNAQGWTVQDNEVRLNYGIGVGVGTDSQMLGNYIHDNGNMGVSGVGNNILVQGNEIASNGYWSGVDVGWEGGGSKFALTDGLVVRENYAHDNNGYGLWTDIDNINTLYEGNYVSNNTQGGIDHEISYDAVIRNNTLVNNGTAPGLNWLWGSQIQLQDSQNVEIYGNVAVTTLGHNGISLIEQGRGTGAYGEYKTANNSVHDNTIISGTPDAGLSGATTDQDSGAVFSQGNTFDSNHYFITDTADHHWIWDEEYSFSDFQQLAGQEINGTVSTSIPSTPAAPVGTHGLATSDTDASGPAPTTPDPGPPPVDAPPPETPTPPVTPTTPVDETPTTPAPSTPPPTSGPATPGTGAPGTGAGTGIGHGWTGSSGAHEAGSYGHGWHANWMNSGGRQWDAAASASDDAAPDHDWAGWSDPSGPFAHGLHGNDWMLHG